MIFRICILTSLLWIQIVPLEAKSKPSLDSLQHAAASQTGLTRVMTLTEIVKRYDLPDGGSLLLCDSIFIEADSLGEHLEAVEAQLIKGHIYFEIQQFDLAMEAYKRANQYAIQQKVEKKYFNTYGAIAGVFEVWNQPDSAMHYASEKIEYWVDKDTSELVDHLERIAYYYHLYGLQLQAYGIYERLLAIGHLKKDEKITASAYTQIACLLGKQQDGEEAESYFLKAIASNHATNSSDQLIVSLTNYGIFVKNREQYEKADSLQREALRYISDDLSNWEKSYFYCYVYHNLTSLYRQQKQWDSTIVIGRKSLQNASNGYHTKVMAATASEMLIAFSELNMLDSAQVCYDLAFSFINAKTNPDQYKIALEGKAIFLARQGKFQEAYLAYQEFKHINDSLNAMTQSQQMAFLSGKFKMEEKNQDIKRLTLEKEKSEAFRNFSFILLLAFAIVASSLIYTYYFRARKNNQLLIKSQEIDQLKSRFFANISHELRTPLTLILGPTETLLSRANAEDKGLLMLIKTHSLRLKKLINQVLELTKIEAGKLTLQVSQQNILPFLNGWVYAFKSQAESKSIELNVTSHAEDLRFFFQKDYLEHIVNNLVHNAIKFSAEGGTVEVLADRSQDDREVLIEIRDNGIGIYPEDIPFIFDRFYQVKNSSSPLYEGTGIGLALTKELVELHGGTIQVTSTPGAGTAFHLRFPVGADHLSADQIIQTIPPATSEFKIREADMTDENLKKSPSLPLVLIVEDQDEVRAYLSSELSRSFQIITANNGQEGLDVARNQVPDLILSDMMMPVMGGLEFANILKDDPITDHIPFIMLTARGETEDVIKALESKVDSYLTKPFHPSELSLRISNLIQLKKNIRQKYATAGEELTEESGYSPKEVQFLSAIEVILKEHLANEQLDVHLLADAMHLSRSQLFRKLRSITGESPSGYIRKFRLEKARQLLQSEDVTVAEASFLVGFNSPGYFSKCFSEQFGQSPGTITRSKAR